MFSFIRSHVLSDAPSISLRRPPAISLGSDYAIQLPAPPRVHGPRQPPGHRGLCHVITSQRIAPSRVQSITDTYTRHINANLGSILPRRIRVTRSRKKAFSTPACQHFRRLNAHLFYPEVCVRGYKLLYNKNDF